MDGKMPREYAPYSVLYLTMQFKDLETKMHNYGTDTPIYHSEIHLISEIAENPDIHVRGLAERMGITSASVSEMLGKLMKKGLVEKTTDKENLSRLKLSLTEKGLHAHKEHMRYHDELNEIVGKSLEGATDEQVAFLNEFCDRLRENLKEFEF